MEKNKRTKCVNLTLPETSRLIFMSDIHGDITLFKEALQGINFSQEDYLFVIGDMIEKGDFLDNKAMLDYIIELSKQKNVYFMAGNCDEVFRFILPPVDQKKFLYYALDLKKSIINDLAADMNYELHKDMNIEDYIDNIQKKYPQYFEFINQLPDIIMINDTLVLVHGGISDIHHIPTSALEVLKYDRFLELSHPQPKTMIVGHYPTRNYHSDIACVNPIFDKRKNIICLDGGNNVVKGGQINVVVLESLKTMQFSYLGFDHYPKYKVDEDITYEQPKTTYSMRFGKNEVEILSKDLDFYLVKPLGSADSMWVNEEFIYKDKDKYFCYEGANTFINLRKGDQISIIKRAMPYSLIKHKGVIGLIETKHIHEDQL